VSGIEQLIVELVAVRVREELAKQRSAAAESGTLISVEKAAKRLDVSESFIRKVIREKKLDYFKVGASVRVRVADVDALAVRGKAPEPDRDEENRKRVLAAARGGRR
jgi:excisionase family DNA binding protein